MPVHHDTLTIRTAGRTDSVDITSRVRDAVARSKIREGVCSVRSMHTTAAVIVNENADPDVQGDILSHLGKLVPKSDEFRHAEGNSDAHIKALLAGNVVTASVHRGELTLGEWQGIFLLEFDGPRERHTAVTVIGD